ncbi:MAG: TIGR02300 family protein [Pseudomonadota bacterium]
MSKQELGVKRDCPECGARFYDLNKDPALCPKCGHSFTPEALLKPRKPRPDDKPAEQETTTEEKPEAETTLEQADAENAEAAPNRKAGLDEEDAEDELEKLGDIDGIDVDDDEEDDALLDDDDDDNDVASIVPGSEDNDDV